MGILRICVYSMMSRLMELDEMFGVVVVEGWRTHGSFLPVGSMCRVE